MKYVLIIVYLLFSLLPVRANELRIEVTEDKHYRPIVIKSFYVNHEGKEVLHGIVIKYDWDIRVVEKTVYKDGVRESFSIAKMGF
jgi:hypothetical protein